MPTFPMSAMPELLIDNDIFYLLAAAGVLDDVLALLGVSKDRLHALPSLKKARAAQRRLQRSTSPDRCYSEEHMQRVLAEIQRSRVQSVQLQDDSLERVAELTCRYTGIDEGELTLLVKLSEDTDCLLLATKDTRFVGALAESDIPEKTAANGKIVLLEHVLALLFRRHGFDYIKEHFVPCRNYDRRLTSIIGTTGKEAAFLDGLTSYIKHDLALGGELLFCFPEELLPRN